LEVRHNPGCGCFPQTSKPQPASEGGDEEIFYFHALPFIVVLVSTIKRRFGGKRISFPKKS
jgi:hypothetical protein